MNVGLSFAGNNICLSIYSYYQTLILTHLMMVYKTSDYLNRIRALRMRQVLSYRVHSTSL